MASQMLAKENGQSLYSSMSHFLASRYKRVLILSRAKAYFWKQQIASFRTANISSCSGSWKSVLRALC